LVIAGVLAALGLSLIRWETTHPDVSFSRRGNRGKPTGRLWAGFVCALILTLGVLILFLIDVAG
jgi:hypothetical protein